MNRKHLFMFAAGFALVGLVAVMSIKRDGDEPAPEKNPPKKESAVKMYNVKGLDLPVVFEDGCNLKSLKIILKDLELIARQTGGYRLGRKERMEFWSILIENKKHVAVETWQQKKRSPLHSNIPVFIDNGFRYVVEYQGVKCFAFSLALAKLYDNCIKLLGEELKKVKQLEAFIAEVEGGLKQYNKLEEVMLYMNTQGVDIASELEAKGELTLGFIQKHLTQKHEMPSILKFRQLGLSIRDGTKKGAPGQYGAYEGSLNVSTKTMKDGSYIGGAGFIYIDGRWKMLSGEPGT